jgi:hypothetical protein
VLHRIEYESSDRKYTGRPCKPIPGLGSNRHYHNTARLRQHNPGILAPQCCNRQGFAWLRHDFRVAVVVVAVPQAQQFVAVRGVPPSNPWVNASVAQHLHRHHHQMKHWTIDQSSVLMWAASSVGDVVGDLVGHEVAVPVRRKLSTTGGGRTLVPSLVIPLIETI